MTLFSYLLLALALALIFLEFFVPGGAFAFAGGTVLLLSFFTFANLASPIALLLFCIGGVLLSIVVIRLALKVIRKSGKRNTIRLDSDQEGYYASSLDPTLFGKVGVILTDLKPTGKMEIEGRLIQVASDQGYLVRGTTVKIVGGEGGHYIVRKI